jgi:hypothetical protein
MAGLTRRMTGLTRLAVQVAAVLLMSTMLQAADTPPPPLLEPRIVDASVAGVSLDRLDVALRIAVRSGRDLTIRSISFADATVSDIPVRIASIEGNWPLHLGQDVEIPRRVIVSVRAIDALGSDDFRDIVRRGSVDVQATVEVAFATPWPARLLMQPATQTAVSPVELTVPIGAGPTVLQPFALLGAAVVDQVQQGVAPFLFAARNALPSNRTIVDRFTPSLATVTTRYAIDDGTTALMRVRQSVGFWWTAAVVCTTREALEPWRFDSREAILLEAGGGRLRPERSVRIESTSRPVIEIDTSTLDRRLAPIRERKVYALNQGKPRRIRLGDRDDVSSVACLRVDDGEDQSAGPAHVAGEPPETAAVFAVNGTRGPLWTPVVREHDAALTLTAAVHRQSFGSPLVTPDGVVGLVVSSTRAWDIRALSTAAARAARVTSRTPGKAAE